MSKVKSELKAKTNWSDSDELAMLFKNTYPPQFYKLQRFVHRLLSERNKEYQNWQICLLSLKKFHSKKSAELQHYRYIILEKKYLNTA